MEGVEGMEADRALDIHRNRQTGLFELWVNGHFEGNYDTVDEAVRDFLDIVRNSENNEEVAV